MCTTEQDATGTWVPQSCTLPTADQPLRVAEFDELFRMVRTVDRPEPGRAILDLDPEPAIAARAAELMVRETTCCSFFTFALRTSGGSLHLDVTVPPSQHQVLDALAIRATAGAVS